MRDAAAQRLVEQGPADSAEVDPLPVAHQAAVASPVEPVVRTDQRGPEVRTPQAAPVEWQARVDQVARGDRAEAPLALAA